MRQLISWAFILALPACLWSQDLGRELQKLEAQKQSLDEQKAALIEQIENIRLQKIRADLKKVGLPKDGVAGELVEHAAMILNYSEAHEQAAWVAHIIPPAMMEGNLSRTNDFRADELVSSGTAVKADYWYSGYDRGHLAPSADFRWSKTAISESYYYSNMSPQLPEFNREGWADLERWVRGAVFSHKRSMLVITGPILKEGLPQITQGPNKVSIPEAFFKVVLDLEAEQPKAIGFIMKNGSCNNPTISYAVSVDEVEAQTGLDFFSNLPEEEEKRLEAMKDPSRWEKTTEGRLADVPPLSNEELPKDCISTADAPVFMNQKACVCGTVVSTKKTKSGSVFINLDTKFPNQIFSVTIWGKDIKHFSFSPETELYGKQICVKGKITDYKGTPTMNITHEKKVEFMEEMPDKK